MNRISLFILLFCLSGGFAYADHPNEGALTLSSLIQEALSNNLDIKMSEKVLGTANAQTLNLFPSLSLEGGPQASKYNLEKNSGVSLYGKLQWNLFRGGRDFAERSLLEVKYKLAKAELESAKSKVARDAAKLYYEMLFILESIALKKTAIEMNRDQMKMAVSKKASGFISGADVIEFELREATLRSDLKQLQWEQESISRDFAVLLGRSETPGLVVQGHLLRDLPQLDRAAIIAKAVETNPELFRAKQGIELSSKAVAISKSEFLPSIDLLAKYGKISTEEKVFSERDNYTAGVLVSFPLFSGFSSVNALKAATFEGERAELERKQKEASLYSEMDKLFSRLGAIKERMDLEEKSLGRSEEYYKITASEYKRGVKNSPDMVTASERLLEAKIRNLEFRKEYHLVFLNIFAAAGMAPDWSAQK